MRYCYNVLIKQGVNREFKHIWAKDIEEAERQGGKGALVVFMIASQPEMFDG